MDREDLKALEEFWDGGKAVDGCSSSKHRCKVAYAAALSLARRDVRELVDAVEKEREAVKLWRSTPPGDERQVQRAKAALDAERETAAIAAKLKEQHPDDEKKVKYKQV